MISFSKDLLQLNPAYNDSIIQFSSNTITGATKAILTIDGMQFLAVPNNNKFTFNFKEIISNLINQNRFFDEILPDLTSENFIYSDPSITKEISVEIKVFSLTANESTTKTYKFIRGVEQLPNYHNLVNIQQDIKVLLPSKNYIDYSARYNEGFPFDFGIYGLQDGDTFYLKNSTTNQQTDTYTATDSDVLRLFFSDGGSNTTDLDLLINSSTLNKLELWVNGNFKANINLTKVESECGILLKFLNSKGSYSYWKFDKVWKSTITPRSGDDFQTNYDNLQNLQASSHQFGKTANQTISLTSTYSFDDAEYLKDLVISPAVWMYQKTEPFSRMLAFDFVEVATSDVSFTVADTKNSKGKLAMTITLPVINTINN